MLEILYPFFGPAATSFTLLSFGLLFGLQHALEADHVSAISTQIIKTRIPEKSVRISLRLSFTKSSILGIIWGAGHTTTLVLMGVLVYFMAITIDEKIFDGLELTAATMIMILGATTIANKKILRFRHRHPHKHSDGAIHFDVHDHVNSDHHHNHKSYLIGTIHGLAGSGGLFVLMGITFESFEMIFSFIFLFGLGSIIGMVLMAGLIGIPIGFSQKIPKIRQIFRYVAGIVSMLIGINITYAVLLSGKPL